MLTGFSLGKTLKATIVNATRALFNDYTHIPLDKLRGYFNFGKGDQFFNRNKLDTVGEGSLTNGSLSNQNVEIPSANLKVGATQDFSLMFWFKSSSAGQNTTLVDCVDSSASSKGFKISLKSNGRITCSMKDDDGTSANDLDSGGSTTNDDGLWHHFAASFDRDGSRYFYIDGELDRSKGISGLDKTIDVDLPWHLMNNNQVTVGNNGFLGSMKNFGVWHRVLKQEEIKNIRYKEYSEFTKTEKLHIKGWYPLESDANDSTGNQNATVTGGTNQTFSTAKYADNTPLLPRKKDNDKRVYGESIGVGSASFDGSDDFINCEDIELNELSGLTVSAWFKANSTGANSRIVSKDQLGVQGCFILWIDGSNDLQFLAHNGSGWKTASYTSFSEDKNWHHVAGVFSATEIKLYLDAVEVASATYSSTTLDDSDNEEFVIGSDSDIANTDEHFTGNIAQVGLWSRALTQGDITKIKEKTYEELTDSEKTNLTSWWSLDTEYLPTELWDENKTDTDIWTQGGSDDDLDIRYSSTDKEFIIKHISATTYADMYLTNAATSLNAKYNTLKTTMDANSTYKMTFQAKVNTGTVGVTGTQASASSTSVTATEYTDYEFYYETDSSVGWTDEYFRIQSLSAGEKLFIKNISVKKLQVQDLHGSNHGSVSGA